MAPAFKSFGSYRPTGLEWLEAIPSHWSLLSTKRLFRETNRKGYPDEPLLSVTQNQGVVPRSELDINVWNPASSTENYKLVESGNFVISLRSFQGGLELSQVRGLVSPAYTVLERRMDFESDFMRWWLKSDVFVSALNLVASGIRQGKNISYEDFARLAAPLPPANEQRAIASFVGRETDKIDALIVKQERLLELLHEKRKAVISHAVTKGLDPSVSMKDSGVEWLGRVPCHWQASELRHEIRSGTSITYGIVQAGPHVEDGVPYIRTGDLAGDALPSGGYQRTSQDIDQQYLRSKVAAGDLIIAIRATVGKALPVPPHLDGANLTQGTAKISPGPNLDRDFLLYFLSSHQAQEHFAALAKGATFKEITLDMLRRFKVPLPPLREQIAIAENLDAKLGSIDALLNRSRTLATTLKERRTALISAAVTGRIDVRDWQPSCNPGSDPVAAG